MSHPRRTHRGRRRPAWSRVRRVGVLFLAFSFTFGAGWAHWTTSSVPGGNGASAAATVDRGETPVASASGSTITVAWAASTLSTDEPVDGYRIARYDASTLSRRLCCPTALVRVQHSRARRISYRMARGAIR